MNNKKSLKASVFAARIGYYYDGALYKFSIEKDGGVIISPTSEYPKVLPCLVVARAHYTEQVKQFPVENKKALNQLLSLEYGDQENVNYHVYKQGEGKSFVNIWTFSASVPKALVTVPESLLIGYSVAQGQVISISKCNTVFYTRFNGGIHSLVTNSIINSPERFAMSIGQAPIDELHELKPVELPQQLLAGLNQKTLPIIASLINFDALIHLKPIVYKLLLPSALMVTLYLSALSGYLVFNKERVEKSLEHKSEEVAMALQQQQMFDRNLAYYQQLKIFTNERSHSAAFWYVMSDMFAHATFTNVRISGDRFVIRGSAEKATKVLEILSKIKGVERAGFDSPTRDSRGKELFVIGFTIDNSQINWNIENGEDA